MMSNKASGDQTRRDNERLKLFRNILKDTIKAFELPSIFYDFYHKKTSKNKLLYSYRFIYYIMQELLQNGNFSSLARTYAAR